MINTILTSLDAWGVGGGGEGGVCLFCFLNSKTKLQYHFCFGRSLTWKLEKKKKKSLGFLPEEKKNLHLRT
jgi:hypothetical protein